MCEVVSQYLFQATVSSTREQTIAGMCSIGMAASSRGAFVIRDINIRESRLETLSFGWLEGR